MSARLAIAVVNYNSGARLRACLDAIASNPPEVPYEVLVIDNRSADRSADFLRAEPRPNVRLLDSPANLLWTAAVNLAFLQTTGEVFLIMNADIAPLPGSLDGMVRRLDEDPGLGAIGGSLVTPAGAAQRYFSRFITPWQLVRLNYLHPDPSGKGRLRRWYAMADEDFSGPLATPRPAGGCIAVRRSLFDGLPLSPEFGIYWSDYELAHRVWDSGSRILVFPDLRFVHDDQAGRTPGNAPRLQDLDYLVGAVRYFRRYHGRWAARQAKVLLAGALAASLLLKHLPRLLLGREPPAMFGQRLRNLGLLVRERNVLLEQARQQAQEDGFLAKYPVL